MSYILDALRKSDQLRRRGAAPTLLLAQATEATPKQPALLYYGLLALVLLGAGIAIGWLRPWQTQPAAPAPAILAVKAPEPAPSAMPASPPALAPPELHAPSPTPAVPLPAPAPAPSPALAQARGAEGGESARQSAPPKALAPEPKKAAAPLPLPAAVGGADAVPATSVMAMAELPLAIQQELPPMSISVHAYSARVAERLVGINNRLLHEGDEVAPGLRLEQITPDGMILGYKGYRFRRGVRSAN